MLMPLGMIISFNALSGMPDEELFSAMLEMYYYNVPKEQHPDVFKKIENQLFGFKSLHFDNYAENIFKNSIIEQNPPLV